MQRLTLNFPVLLILVAAWLALAYSGPLVSALSEYGVHGFTQVKLMVFIAFFYTVALAISRCVNAFKPFAILLFVLAAPALFYMSEYGIIIDADMIINAIETDTAEAREQLSGSFFAGVYKTPHFQCDNKNKTRSCSGDLLFNISGRYRLHQL